VALLLSIFLVYYGRNAVNYLPGCGDGSDCHSVVNSPWALIGVIPVAWIGVTGFSVLLAGIYGSTRFPPGEAGRRWWFFLVAAALVGAGFSVWLLAIQAWEIGHFCLYCVSFHLAGLFTYAGVVLLAPLHPMGRGVCLRLLLVAGGGLAWLIAAHVVWLPSDFVVHKVGVGGRVESVEQPEQPELTSRPVALMNGGLVFNAADVPLMGSMEADCILAKLYDPTCVACRKVYHQLEKYQTLHPGQLAVALFLVPLHPECNPSITVAPPESGLACAYARLSAAVFVADRRHYPAFHRYLMGGDQVPDLESATRAAGELVGAERLDIASKDPAVDQLIHDAVQLFRYAGGTSVPRIILPDQVVATAGGAENKLFALLDQVCAQQRLK
jgi:uncharacterized membrane protein/protein-disulfide isomerase